MAASAQFGIFRWADAADAAMLLALGGAPAQPGPNGAPVFLFSPLAVALPHNPLGLVASTNSPAGPGSSGGAGTAQPFSSSPPPPGPLSGSSLGGHGAILLPLPAVVGPIAPTPTTATTAATTAPSAASAAIAGAASSSASVVACRHGAVSCFCACPFRGCIHKFTHPETWTEHVCGKAHRRELQAHLDRFGCVFPGCHNRRSVWKKCYMTEHLLVVCSSGRGCVFLRGCVCARAR